ncbi:bifunctional 2'%2C3'-cyclic nucleotide 2'-phosphodiesterase/3'-nucleotidase precursor protein [Streptococcus suis]|nr:bifunctional 2'%2C3'-cyclic nucleotide 2'-phosphodiesterase/3'-nucleotidase precursor protein [Streptococcus suis]
MNFRFSKCAVALTLALLAASNPKLAQAEEILNTTPASSTEASQAVPVESDTTEEADNTESPVPATTEAENPSSSETAETSDPTSETTDTTTSEARTVTLLLQLKLVSLLKDKLLMFAFSQQLTSIRTWSTMTITKINL